ncbi:MAG: hypothetical protein DRP42_06530 [Tenericutes bacterium]|nr:MAG: hypothetical protein DRP42_06530 [Mycoplasmatota bacterium]
MASQTQQAIAAIVTVTGHSEGTLRLTTSQRTEVVNALFTNFENEEYSIKSAKATATDESVKKYISSQVSDVLKKQPIFNSGNAYAPNKSGTRNKEVKAMRMLLEKAHDMQDQEMIDTVQAELDSKLKSLNVKKVKQIVEADVPESLRRFL